MLFMMMLCHKFLYVLLWKNNKIKFMESLSYVTKKSNTANSLNVKCCMPNQDTGLRDLCKS